MIGQRRHVSFQWREGSRCAGGSSWHGAHDGRDGLFRTFLLVGQDARRLGLGLGLLAGTRGERYAPHVDVVGPGWD